MEDRDIQIINTLQQHEKNSFSSSELKKILEYRRLGLFRQRLDALVKAGCLHQYFNEDNNRTEYKVNGKPHLPRRCGHCNELFNSNRGLRIHLASAHGDDEDE